MIKKHKPCIGDYVMAECYKAEIAKVKKQLAIAVEALEYYKDKKTWCLCEKSQCAYVDGMTADLALKKIKELENDRIYVSYPWLDMWILHRLVLWR